MHETIIKQFCCNSQSTEMYGKEIWKTTKHLILDITQYQGTPTGDTKSFPHSFLDKWYYYSWCYKIGFTILSNRFYTYNSSKWGFSFSDIPKGKFVLFNDASSAHWFLYHRLLDVKSSIWSLCHIYLEETRCCHIGYSFR